MSKPQPGNPEYDKTAEKAEKDIGKMFNRKMINNLDTKCLEKLHKLFYRLTGEFGTELREKSKQSIGSLKGQINIMKREMKRKSK